MLYLFSLWRPKNFLTSFLYFKRVGSTVNWRWRSTKDSTQHEFGAATRLEEHVELLQFVNTEGRLCDNSSDLKQTHVRIVENVQCIESGEYL